ncbi:hypothetical protein [Chelativorans sp. YIM 93263]|uniref:hypothetical protein n=1 Tax=Chelativorans sp. YIM 93263 TaxID=2906648 RepID=UPI002379C7BA|nr:hypothetical protein [Chelativorans sp. YIM 93263]
MVALAEHERRDDGRRYFIQMGIAFLFLLGLASVPLVLSDAEKQFFLSEGGPIQVFSAAGYLIAMATVAREIPSSKLFRLSYLLIIPMAMCLRELDFHAHFTTDNITKTTLYLSPDVPLLEKLFGVSVLAVLGLSFYALLKDQYRPFVAGLRRGEPVSVAVAAAIGCAVVSKVLDGAESNLEPLGIHISTTYTSTLFEEVLELGIPIFLCIAVFAAFPRNSSNR